jgi:hypothetical protein
MQVEFAHEVLELEVLRPTGRTDFQPTRLPLGKLLNAMTASYLIQCVAHDLGGEKMMAGEALLGDYLDGPMRSGSR